MKKVFELDAEYQPESFVFTKANQKVVKELIGRYPGGKQQSAVMPLLDLAQRQVASEGAKANPPYGGWIPRAAMDHNAEVLSMPAIKDYEDASLYTMYNTATVGKNMNQV